MISRDIFCHLLPRNVSLVQIKVVSELVPESLIELSTDEYTWVEDSTSYGHHMARSRYCIMQIDFSGFS